MRIKDLHTKWQQAAGTRRTAREYAVRLPLHDAARIHALAELYPGRNETEIITDLLSTALDELEAAMPYIQGNRIIAEDEQGDPIYEDVGPTPKWLELSREHERRLNQEFKQRDQQIVHGKDI